MALSAYINAIVARMKADFPDLASYIREYGALPEGRSYTDSDPPFEIVVSVGKSDANPEKYDYVGDMVMDVMMEAFIVRQIRGDEDAFGDLLEEHDEPLDAAHRILYWAQYTDIPGQVRLPVPFEGGITRGVLADPYQDPDDDITRVAYQAWWNVEYAFTPSASDTILPEIFDDSFEFPLTGVNVDSNAGDPNHVDTTPVYLVPPENLVPDPAYVPEYPIGE